MIAFNPDGTFAIDCALCGQPLTNPFFATSHFILDSSHELWPFSDAAMHWDCYARWPQQTRFAGLYFESRARWSAKKYWQTMLHCEDVFVEYGLTVNEVAIVLRRSGSALRVAREKWSAFLAGEWRGYCCHPLETASVEEVLPLLLTLELPAPSPLASDASVFSRPPSVPLNTIPLNTSCGVNPFFDPEKRNIVLAGGGKDLLDVLRERRRRGGDPACNFISEMLWQAATVGAAELLIGARVVNEAECTVNQRIGEKFYHVSTIPAEFRAWIVAELLEMAGLSKSPFPVEGAVVLPQRRATQFWKLSSEGSDADCHLTSLYDNPAT